MPLGLYAIKSINKPLKDGDIVAVCLVAPYQNIGLARSYILAGSRCNGSAPLIKMIIAIPGDSIILADEEITVNNFVYHYPTETYDSKHRQLPKWPRGNYPNTKGYWLIGTNNSHSWDSRYWGFVQYTQIIYLLKPLWILSQ